MTGRDTVGESPAAGKSNGVPGEQQGQRAWNMLTKGSGALTQPQKGWQVTWGFDGLSEEFGSDPKSNGKPLEQRCPIEIKCEPRVRFKMF